MNVELYPANVRKHIKVEDKFDSWQSFSFGAWHDEKRSNFHSLRVFNDDIIGIDSEIDLHPHKNFEILSVMIDGKMSHKDSLGNYQEIETDAIQLISCGSGIYHSGKNLNKNNNTHFLQIWVAPDVLNTKPDLSLVQFSKSSTIEQWDLRVCPQSDNTKINVKQNCFCSRGVFKDNTSYHLYDADNAVWLFVLSGSIEINGCKAQKADAIMIESTNQFNIKVLETADLWLMELA